MVKRLLANELLKEAVGTFDAAENNLAKSSRTAWRHGFASGSEWMREALLKIRGDLHLESMIPSENFHRLGLIKYGLALLAPLLVLLVAVLVKQPWLILMAVPAFYFVEVQMAFLFPLAIDGSPRPFHESQKWTKRAGGTWQTMMVIMPIAATMLFGGFCGRGFVRSWSIGCLAILIWYERLKTEKPPARRRRLEINGSQPLTIRKERFTFSDSVEPIRLLYASDLHFLGRNSRPVGKQLIASARETSPDVILLGGDLVDAKCGLPLLCETVRQLREVAPVWAINGNHDRLAGLNNVKMAVENGGGNWLGGKSVLLPKPRHRALWLDGSIPDNLSDAHRRLLCAHDPSIFPEAVKKKYSLVLAGHLHGGQCVLAERNGRLLPAGWFYRWNGLRFEEANSTMLVSRGVSDTLPVRWNCTREVILCEIF